MGWLTALAIAATVLSCDVGGDHQVAAATAAPVRQEHPANADTVSRRTPELPRAGVNTSMPAVTGRTIAVAANANLQNAIDGARPGDVIVLPPGATFRGNFVLPAKQGSGWIVIRGDVQLPDEGQRMSPARATALRLPRIVSDNTEPAVATAPGAHHYRLVGVEISLTGRQRVNYGLVTLGGRQTRIESVPHSIVLDRVYVHGHPSVNLRRCVALNSAWTAVIDSYLSECHADDTDAQAIAGWNGPGPYKIVNNYLEGSGENILFGGADPSIRNLVPADIEIRGNHVTRPTSYRGRWLVKNLLELKNATRVLIEGNVFQNNWQHGQDGVAILFLGVNQGGSAPWSGVSDVTFRSNVVKNVGGGFIISTHGDNGPVQPTSRIAISNNVVHDINVVNDEGDFSGVGRGLTTQGDVRDVLFEHNTLIAPTNSALTVGPLGTRTTRLAFVNNVTGGGGYGIAGDGAIGARGFGTYAPDGSFVGNVVIMSIRADEMPQAGNWYPSSISAVGFENPRARDYRLSASSRYRSVADGKSPGANVAAVLTATRNVVQ